jgi:hypothetical protein
MSLIIDASVEWHLIKASVVFILPAAVSLAELPKPPCSNIMEPLLSFRQQPPQP